MIKSVIWNKVWFDLWHHKVQTLLAVLSIAAGLSPGCDPKYWHTMSYQEIVQTLNTTVNAIKSRLFRARKMMAQAVTTQAAPAQQRMAIPSGHLALAANYGL
jgi:hypothetical protein